MKNKIQLLASILLMVAILFTACKKDEKPTVTANSLEVTIPENPTQNQVVGTINATVNNANNFSYLFNSGQTGLAEHLSINRTSGEITITDTSYFDYEQRASEQAFGTVEAFNSSDEMASASFTLTINLTDVDETTINPKPVASVQSRLDKGETPIQIYNTDNSLLDSLYGKLYLKGLIFQFDASSGKGMLAATSDQSASLEWDFNTSNLKVTGATDKSVGKGESNTFVITTKLGTGGSYAAQKCSDAVINGYSGWFLPSFDELELMYKNLHAKGKGSFQNTKYWSSSEMDQNSAWYRDFGVSSGQTAGTIGKYNTYAVRAFRKF